MNKIGVIWGLLLILSAISEAGAQPKNGAVLTVDDSTFAELKAISRLSTDKTFIDLSVTTHQDLAWINSIEKCIINRDTMWLTPFLKRLRDDPAFQMDVEQSSIIGEYISRHPDRKDTVTKYLKNGRMLVGAAYTQAYEDMYSGESLARQFYLGKLWLKEHFNGYNSTTYYNSDVPGRTLQMPQLMAKAGVSNMFFSRFRTGVFNWYSPDGSFVTAYSPGHYIDFYNILAKDNPGAVKAMAEETLYWLKNYNDKGSEKRIPAVLNYEFMWNQQPVKNLDPFIHFWNQIEEIVNARGEHLKIRLPKFRFATVDQFISGIRQSTSKIPAIAGERPNEWIYIHGPSHHWAFAASRRADILLPAAEKFSTFNMLLNGSPAKYPKQELEQAWRDKIYPDHGWGGKEGQSTDDIFLSKFKEAESKSDFILRDAMQNLASKIKCRKSNGIPVIVFNSLSWQRTDPLTVTLNLTGDHARSVKVYNAAGKLLPAQLGKCSRDPEGFIIQTDLTFIVENVPSIGYDTYYIKTDIKAAPAENKKFVSQYENNFYRIEFGAGGISGLFDKTLKKNILNTQGFKAGDVFVMQSVGNGAGEFAAVQQPDMKEFDKTSNHPVQWELAEDGDIYTLFKYRQPIKDAVIEQYIKVYKPIRRIDFNPSIKNWDGSLYREYRMALPVDILQAKLTYEVPFGAVEIGKDELKEPAGERYMTIPSEIHPRGMENWVNASGKDFGITMSSSVAAFDFKDVTGLAEGATLLQPILLASRKSCHSEGNEYLQTGDHDYFFSITTDKPGTANSFHFGRQANEELRVVVNPEPYADASLPERGSFVSVNAHNIIITAFKKAEDGDAVVMRFYETAGKDTDAEFSFSTKFKKAVATSLIEEAGKEIPIQDGRLKVRIPHNSIETIKLFR